jgi:hypothetical protein
MTKPLIAVQLAGYMRTLNDVFKSWNNLLDHNNFDFHFFVETYIESGTLPIDTRRNNGYDIDMSNVYDFSMLKEVADVKYLATEQTTAEMNTKGPQCDGAIRYKNMYRKILNCNNARKEYAKNNNIEYAYVLKVRGELFFTQKINLPTTLDTNKIIVPSRWGYVRGDENNNFKSYRDHGWAPNEYNMVVCDQFAIAGLNAMDAYADTGEKIGYDKIEQYIFKSLNNNNIQIERQDFRLGVYNHKSGK